MSIIWLFSLKLWMGLIALFQGSYVQHECATKPDISGCWDGNSCHHHEIITQQSCDVTGRCWDVYLCQTTPYARGMQCGVSPNGTTLVCWQDECMDTHDVPGFNK